MLKIDEKEVTFSTSLILGPGQKAVYSVPGMAGQSLKFEVGEKETVPGSTEHQFVKGSDTLSIPFLAPLMTFSFDIPTMAWSPVEHIAGSVIGQRVGNFMLIHVQGHRQPKVNYGPR